MSSQRKSYDNVAAKSDAMLFNFPWSAGFARSWTADATTSSYPRLKLNIFPELDRICPRFQGPAINFAACEEGYNRIRTPVKRCQSSAKLLQRFFERDQCRECHSPDPCAQASEWRARREKRGNDLYQTTAWTTAHFPIAPSVHLRQRSVECSRPRTDPANPHQSQVVDEFLPLASLLFFGE